MNTTHRLTLAALVAVASGACSRYDDRPAEWAYISPAIFQPNCATTSCHSPAAAVDGLDFSTPQNGYASLTGLGVFVPDGSVPLPGALCKKDSGTTDCYDPRPLVTPYDPADSQLVNTLRALDAPRMPPDRPLPEDDIELVERWILNGALEYPNSPPPPDSGGTVKPRDAGADGKPHLDAALTGTKSDAHADQGGD